MVFSSRLRSPSSVLGGKNSNEITGRFSAWRILWMSRMNCTRIRIDKSSPSSSHQSRRLHPAFLMTGGQSTPSLRCPEALSIMKVGVFTVILGSKKLEATLDYLSALGVQAIELGAGGYARSPH